MSQSRHTPAREAICSACRRLADRGYLAGTGGNVSIRCGEGLFAVTPSGVDYYAMSPKDICIVRLDTLEMVEGHLRPSVECALHATVLRGRPDAGAVIHTHQPLVSAIALLHLPIPVGDEASRRVLGDSMEAVPYAPSGTGLLARAVRKRLQAGVNAYILRNHGLVCCGATLVTAIEAVELAERAAARFLRQAIARNGARGELADSATTTLDCVLAGQ